MCSIQWEQERIKKGIDNIQYHRRERWQKMKKRNDDCEEWEMSKMRKAWTKNVGEKKTSQWHKILTKTTMTTWTIISTATQLICLDIEHGYDQPAMESHRTCGFCGNFGVLLDEEGSNDTDLVKCSRCKSIRYCDNNRVCQRADCTLV